MGKKLKSTATGEMEEVNPLLLDREIHSQKDIKPVSLDSSGSSDINTKGYDAEFQAYHEPSLSNFDNNTAAIAQSGGNKVGRAIGAGLLEGTVGAAGAITDMVGGLVGLVDENMGQEISLWDSEMKETIADAYKIHESDTDSQTSFMDEFWRASTLKSTVSSAAEFGLIGMGSGFGVGLLGKSAIKLGLNANKLKFIKGATEELGTIKKLWNSSASGVGRVIKKTGELATQDLRAFSKATNGVGKFINKNLSSSVLARSAMSNYFEGAVMGEETRRDMYKMYKDAIENPETSPAMRKMLEAEIQGAGDKMQMMNTLMLFSDVVGFNVLDRVMGKSAKQAANKGFLSTVVSDMKLVAPSEFTEEVLQNVIQSSAKFMSQVNIEEEYAELSDEDKIKGVNGINALEGIYKPENTLLGSVNKSEAIKLSFNNAKSLSTFLIDQATSRQALIEGLSGLFGGGPQWIITGSAGAYGNFKAKKEQAVKDEAFLVDNVEGGFGKFIKETTLSDATLDQVIESLPSVMPTGTDKEAIREVVEEFAIEKLAIQAAQNGHVGALTDYIKDSRTDIKNRVKEETLSKEDGKKFTSRLDKLEAKIRVLHNDTQHINAERLLTARLNLLAYSSALDIYNKTQENVEAEIKNNLDEVEADPDVKRNMLDDIMFPGEKVDDSELSDEGEIVDGSDATIDSNEDVQEEDLVDEGTVKPEDRPDATLEDEEEAGEAHKRSERTKTPEEIAEEEKERVKHIVRKTSDTKVEISELEGLIQAENALIDNLTSAQGKIDGYTLKKYVKKYNKKVAKLQEEGTKSEVSSAIEMAVDKLKDKNVNKFEKQAILGYINTLSKLDAQIEKSGDTKKPKTKNPKKSTKQERRENRRSKRKTSEPKIAPDANLEDLADEVEEDDSTTQEPEVTESDNTTDDEKEISGDDMGENDLDAFFKAMPKEDLDQVISVMSRKFDENKESQDTKKGRVSDEEIEAGGNITPNIDNSTESLPVKVGSTEYAKMVGVVSRMLDSMISVSKDGATLPSRNTIGMVLSELGYDRDSVNKAVIMMYSVYEGKTLDSYQAEKKFSDPVEHPEEGRNSFTDDSAEKPTYRKTVKSYAETAAGIGWDGEIIKDYTLINEGTDVTFEVVEDEEEIAKFNIKYGNENLNADGTQNEQKEITYAKYLKLRKDFRDTGKPNIVSGPTHAEIMVVPIRVRLNKPGHPHHGAVIGHVHTGAFAKRGGVDYDGVNVDQKVVDEAFRTTQTIRKAIIKAHLGKKVAGAKIASRRSSIHATQGEHGMFFEGTAIAGNAYPLSSSVVFNDDSDVVFGGRFENDTEKETREILVAKGVPDAENAEIIISPHIAVGDLVVYIRLEDTNIYVARKVITEPVSTKVLEGIGDIIFGLDKGIINSMVYKLKDKADGKGGAFPSVVKRLVSSVINTDTPVDLGDGSKRVRVQIEAKDPRVDKETGKMGNGSFIIHVGANGKSATITYQYGKDSDGITRYSTPVAVINGVEVSLNEASKIFTDAVEHKGSSPFQNIDYSKLRFSQLKQEKHMMFSYTGEKDSSTNGYSYKQVDYVESVVKPNTVTNIARSTTLANGTKSYTVNTIVSIDVGTLAGEVGSKKSKKKKKVIVKSKEDKRKKSAFDTAKSKLDKEIEAAERELEAADSLFSSLGITVATSYRQAKKAVEKSLKANPTGNQVKYLKAMLDKKIFNAVVAGVTEQKARVTTLKNNRLNLTDKIVAEINADKTKKGLSDFFDIEGEADSSDEVLYTDQDLEDMAGATTETGSLDPDPVIKEQKEKIKSEPKTKTDLDVTISLAISAVSRFRSKFLKRNKETFSTGEKTELEKSFFATAIEVFLGSGKTELDTENVELIYASSINLFIKDIEKAIEGADKYIDSLLDSGYTATHKRVIQADEYITALERLISDEGTVELAAIVDKGFNKTLRALGYTKLIDRTGRKKSDADTLAETEEDPSNEVSSWQDINYSLLKNPKDMVTARVKAKLISTTKYVVVNGEVTESVGILGTPETSTDAYLTVLDLFNTATFNHNLQSKKDVLKTVVDDIIANPVRNAHIYFLVDIYNQLTDSKVLNAFSAQEQNQFNVATNKNRFNAKGLIIKASRDGESSRIYEEDYNYASVYKKMIRDIRGLLDKIDSAAPSTKDSNTEFASESDIIKALINPNKVSSLPSGGKTFKDKLDTLKTILLGKRINGDLSGESLKTLLGLSSAVYSIMLGSDAISKSFSAKNQVAAVFPKSVKNPKTNKLEHDLAADLLADVLAGVHAEIAHRIVEVLNQLKVPIPNTLETAIIDSLNKGEEITKVDFDGVPKGSTGYLADELQSAFNSILLYLGDKVDDKKIKGPLKNVLYWITATIGTPIKSAVIRIKSKLVGTFNDPISLLDNINKLNDPNHRSYLRAFLFTSSNKVLDLKDGLYEGKIDWIKNIFSNVKRAGLLPTSMSKLTEPDSPLAHAFYTIGSYIKSVSNPTGLGTVDYSTLTMESENPNGDPVKHVVKVREGQFVTLTFSDKEAPFTVNSLDFDIASTNLAGEVEMDESSIRFIMDSIVLPEIIRMLETGHLSNSNLENTDSKGKVTNADSVADYNGNLLYSLPLANTPELFALLDTIRGNLEGDLTTLFGNSNKNDSVDKALKKLEALLLFEFRGNLSHSAYMYINHLLDTGMLEESNGTYTLNKKVANLKEFAQYKITRAEKSKKLKLAVLKKSGRKDTTNATDATEAVDKITDTLLNLTMDLTYKVEDGLGLDQIRKGLSTIFTDKAIDAAINRVAVDPDLQFESDVYKLAGVLKILGFNHLTEGELSDAIPYEKPTLEKTADPALRAKFRNYLANHNMANMGETTSSGNTVFNNKEMWVAASLAYTVMSDSRVKPENATDELDFSKFLNMIINREAGQMFMNGNMMALVHGDPAMYFKLAGENYAYNDELDAKGEAKIGPGHPDFNHKAAIAKSALNLGKRLGKEVSPGMFADGSDRTIYIGIKDPIRVSRYYNAESDTYTDVGKMEAMDGGTYVTEKSYIEFLLSEGAIDRSDIGMVKRYWNGEETFASMEKHKKGLGTAAAATTHKPRYVGTRVRTLPNGKKERIEVYIKVAETVLTKKLAGAKGSRLYAIRELMEKVEGDSNKQVRLTPHTGTKAGFVGKPLDLDSTKIDPDTGKFIIDSNALRASEMDLSMDGYARQLVTQYKEDKKVKNSGQMENLAWNSVPKGHKLKVGKGKSKIDIRKEWDRVVTLISDLGIKKVYKIFNGGKDIDLTDKKALAKLTFEYSDRKLRGLILNSFQAHYDVDPTIDNPVILEELEIGSDGNFVHPLADSKSLITYMDAIRKAIEKNTINRKRDGSQLALMPDVDYDFNKVGEDPNGILLFDNAEIEKDGSLRPQVVGKNGKPGKGAQIVIPFEYTLADGTKLDLRDFKYNKNKGIKGKPAHWVIDSSKIPMEIFNQIGFRTPTQDYNMMAHIEVVGFLPESVKTTVIAPKEFIAIMGSDFDIDKLFAYKYYLRAIKEEVVNEDGSKSLHTIGYAKVDEKFAEEQDSEDLKLKALLNRKQDILQAILSDPNIIAEDIVQTLNGEDAFEDFADELYSISQMDTYKPELVSLSYLSGAYNEIKRNNASTAGVALAVFAKLARVSAQLAFSPMPLFLGKNRVKQTISLGSANNSLTVKTLGGDNNLFGETDPTLGNKKYRESIYDKVKNNISALISMAVDNENLQIIHKLGINSKTYDTINGLILGGFRAKTALAIVNMPFMGSADAKSRLKARLISMYNKTKGIPYKIAAKSDSGKTVVIDNTYFTGASTGMQEMDLVERLMNMNERMRSNATLGPDEIIDMLALISFTEKITESYTNSISKVGWAFNMDSKGFPREIALIFKRINSLADKKLDGVWEAMNKITEVSIQLKAFNMFTSKVEDIFSKSKLARQVYEVLAKVDVDADMFRVYTISKSHKYRNSKPNYKSLVARLEVLRTSRDPEVREFWNTNYFLSRISVTRRGIEYNQEEGVPPVDIIGDLEALRTYGTMAGVDLKVLHEDLVKYGATNRFQSYASDFGRFVRPKYLKFLDDAADVLLNPNYVAAYFIYSQLHAKTGKKPELELIDVAEAKLLGLDVWKTRDDSGEDILMYSDQAGEPRKFTEKNFTSFFKESTSNRTEPLISRVDKSKKLRHGSLINFHDTIERVLSYKKDLGAKALFKMLFPNSVVVTNTEDVSEASTTVMRVKGQNKMGSDGKRTNVPLGVYKANLTHEAMHVLTNRVIKYYLAGKLELLFPGTTEESTAMAEEIERVLDSLDEARGSVVDGIITSALKNKGLTMSSTNAGVTMDHDATIVAIAGGVFNSLSDTSVEEHLTEEQAAEISEVTNVNITYLRRVTAAVNIMQTGQYIIQDGILYVSKVNNPNAKFSKEAHDGSTRISEKELSSSYVKSYDGDLDTERLMNLVRSTFTKPNGIEFLKMVTNNTESEDTFLSKVVSYSDLVYSTISMYEFMANSYALGTKTKTSKGEVVPGLSDLSGYKSIVSSAMPLEYASIFHKAFLLLRKLINKIIGKNNANELFKDAMYTASLTKMSKFVSPKPGQPGEYESAEEVQETLKNCK